MALDIRQFSVTIPAGTLPSANFQSKMTFPPRQVQRIDVTVPPGPRGNMGFQIGSDGVAVFPSNPGAFIITDNNHFEWPVTDQHDSGAWSLLGYNTGQYDHTVYITFLLELPDTATPATPSSDLAIAGPVAGSSG